MLQEAKDLQNRAVTQLVSALSQGKKEYTFRAPTGSGKTYMMADFMNRILATQSNVVFMVSSLSKSELAEQNYNSFCALSQNGTFPNLNPHLINSETSGEGALHIPTDHNVYVLPRDLYKEKSRLKDEGTFLNFLQTITGDIFENQASKSIYVIKDECHIATKNLNELNDYFSVIINFSATPKLSRGQLPDVEISNNDAVKAKLIKTIEHSDNVESLDSIEKKNKNLDTALNKFEEIKQHYNNKLAVNPCFIIQISNKDKAEEELQTTIYPTLNNTNHQDLKWVYISGNERDCDTNDNGLKKLPVSRWKTYLKGKNSSISVIIFKMVISEGWDIPRACMLYQVRDTRSKQLDEQVMGRVRRNPRLLDFETLPQDAQYLACTAWVWGIMPQDIELPKQVHLVRNSGIEETLKISPTKLKKIASSRTFNVAIFIKKQRDNRLTHKSIFEMHRQLSTCNNEIQELCYSYAKTFDKWRKFIENIDKIKQKYNSYICDYQKSMIVENAVSFPLVSYYNNNEKTLTIDDWIWCRKDGDEFSFDSDAEKKWAELLKDIRQQAIGQTNLLANNKFLWGKNFPMNSEIKFEYFLDGIHSSYPDFIMKDKRGKIHIFEVKSVNQSANMTINTEEYEKKVNALKSCYTECSKKTKHIFYLPILDGNTWQITKYENGEESLLDKQSFKQSFS
ncbi:MAG: DEAD/DEAH box helicase family protein [Paludibacteraceae bacterium]|nr:DEAD/DEAH box helicase family protein [Paludibacteraceae bacterium]